MSETSVHRSQGEHQGRHQRRSQGARFSVLNLLVFTALIAVGLAIGLAYRLNRSLNEQLAQLVALSGRLPINREDELGSATMPAVADNFYSWHVNVPDGQDYDLRLGMGDISDQGVPPIVGSVRIPSGQHRVTLYTGDSAKEEFRYAVYLDGTLVMEKTMGSQWMPNGWSSSHSIDWPRSLKSSSRPLQLSAQSYAPNPNLERQNYFNGQSDEYVTRPGYRLWIDKPDRTYEAASLFIGFPDEPRHTGIGLRDGLRYRPASFILDPWNGLLFTRPRLETREEFLRVEAEFITSDGKVLSGQSPSFESWDISNSPTGNGFLRWQEEPSLTTQTAFLHAVIKSADGLQPVVELKWDVNQPDAVGIRLADTPANDQIVRWRLRIIDGSYHLWRELQIGDRPWITPTDAVNADHARDENSTNTPARTVDLELGEVAAKDVQFRWRTNEKLPLQIVARKDNRYAGLRLYQGLPTSLGIQVPVALKPKLSVDVTDKHPTIAETAFPGGPVFDAIQIEFVAVERDWIWLSAELKQ